jgi:3-oxoacyl-(acyl-carrier-protein) synthase
MSLGEGAAVLVLEPEASARARQAPILAYLAGRGNTCDAYHATRPAPDGSGIYRAMILALADAGLQPAEVNYVNAHGTGTGDNDLAESRALTRLFGDRPPPISSTKRFFGHTLAAAGAIEAAVCVLALQHQRLPVNLGLTQPDPEIAFQPVTEPVNADLRAVLSNSLGFGGACSSLVICRGDS